MVEKETYYDKKREKYLGKNKENQGNSIDIASLIITTSRSYKRRDNLRIRRRKPCLRKINLRNLNISAI
jgi:hypothetical protein